MVYPLTVLTRSNRPVNLLPLSQTPIMLQKCTTIPECPQHSHAHQSPTICYHLSNHWIAYISYAISHIHGSWCLLPCFSFPCLDKPALWAIYYNRKPKWLQSGHFDKYQSHNLMALATMVFHNCTGFHENHLKTSHVILLMDKQTGRRMEVTTLPRW